MKRGVGKEGQSGKTELWKGEGKVGRVEKGVRYREKGRN